MRADPKEETVSGLTGQVAVVTGGSAGIGRGIARCCLG